MRRFRHSWIVGAVVTAAVIAAALSLFMPKATRSDDPWAHLPDRPTHTDHTVTVLEGPFGRGEEVTEACLQCHPDAAGQVMQTSHWTWENGPYALPGHDSPVLGGKKHVINNFCIGINPNWPPCTACHIGYGWEDDTFDFMDETKVDCLACHDTTGTYVKANAGYPAATVDLATVAQNVGLPTRATCGSCHFKGGGGDAVKHGDLDASLMLPDDDLDVHMGRHDMECTDCHRTEDHRIRGKAISVGWQDANVNQVACTDCHDSEPHTDDRLNAHSDSVACQSCHIPAFARKESTKMEWDWSAAGQDLPQDPHQYLKIKGSFVYKSNVVPDYYWYNDTSRRYVAGDKIDPVKETELNPPGGSIDDPTARIWPFKVHHATQIYDTEYNHLLIPKTFGEGGYWTDFDWDRAARLGAESNGIAYSGHYDFAPTAMYWPITHMVAPKEKALQCDECHVERGQGPLDWKALGYAGDPMFYGGRAEYLRSIRTRDDSQGGAQ